MDDASQSPRTPLDAEVLDRYLAGEASAAETAMVERWLAEDSAHHAVVRGLASQASEQWNTAAAWSAIAPRLRDAHVTSLPVRRMQEWWKVAAAVVILAGGAAAVQLARTANARDDTAILHASAPRGERFALTLPDSTRVTLSAGSTLSYPVRFTSDTRSVTLEGEAYFAVEHDVAHPFVVHSNGATTRVLGTEFDVRAFAGDRVDVVVVNGRVQLTAEGSDADTPVLTAGQRGRLNLATASVVVDSATPAGAYVAWKDGHLRLDARPLGSVLPDLARWFDASFVVSDSSLAARRLTADFRVGNGASLDAVLDALTLALDATYERHGHTIVFRPRRVARD
jgi:ferric-dicitrate binding protein FerR (iron transport regulator)